MSTKQTYIAADSAQYADYQLWLEQEPDSPLKAELALLKFNLSRLAREGGSVALIRDLSTAVTQMQKCAMQQKLALGQMFSLEQVREFRDLFSAILEKVLREEIGDGWEDVVGKIADEYEVVIKEAQRNAVRAVPRITTD